MVNNFKYFKFKIEPFTIANNSENEVEVNLIHQHQENLPYLIVHRNSNNGKNKSRKVPSRFFVRFLIHDVLLFFLALIGICIGVYAVIAHTQSQNSMEKELENLKKEVSSQQTLIKRLETALAKKEKQYNEANQRLATFKAQIFSLSKTVTEGDDSTD